MTYDALLCVAPEHRPIALLAIRSLRLFARPRKIVVLTARGNFGFFSDIMDGHSPVQLVDEDEVIEGVTLDRVQAYLRRRVGTPERAGWYFQQFLKMAACHLSDLADHYLVWDSDTILLRPLDFFQNEQVLINPKEEHHLPYFEWMNKVLGLHKGVEFSFISEHFMMRKTYMRELITRMTSGGQGHGSWVWRALDAIDDSDLNSSGFSEYETYGNFITERYPDSYACRPLKTMRFGTRRFSQRPSRYDLWRLMLRGYCTVTFEVWDGKDLLSWFRIIFNKAASSTVHAWHLVLWQVSRRTRFGTLASSRKRFAEAAEITTRVPSRGLDIASYAGDNE